MEVSQFWWQLLRDWVSQCITPSIDHANTQRLDAQHRRKKLLWTWLTDMFILSLSLGKKTQNRQSIEAWLLRHQNGMSFGSTLVKLFSPLNSHLNKQSTRRKWSSRRVNYCRLLCSATKISCAFGAISSKAHMRTWATRWPSRKYTHDWYENLQTQGHSSWPSRSLVQLFIFRIRVNASLNFVSILKLSMLVPIKKETAQ